MTRKGLGRWRVTERKRMTTGGWREGEERAEGGGEAEGTGFGGPWAGTRRQSCIDSSLPAPVGSGWGWGHQLSPSSEPTRAFQPKWTHLYVLYAVWLKVDKGRRREKLDIWGRGLEEERMSWGDGGRGSALAMRRGLGQTETRRDGDAAASPADASKQVLPGHVFLAPSGHCLGVWG